MFFSFSFSERHLKELKKHNEVFYKLCSKLSIFSQSSIEELITYGKENGITKITDRSIYKALQVDTIKTLLFSALATNFAKELHKKAYKS